jgi:hypothetical protein
MSLFEFFVLLFLLFWERISYIYKVLLNFAVSYSLITKSYWKSEGLFLIVELLLNIDFL